MIASVHKNAFIKQTLIELAYDTLSLIKTISQSFMSQSKNLEILQGHCLHNSNQQTMLLLAIDTNNIRA